MDTSDSKSSSVSSALREIRNELKSLSREIRGKRWCLSRTATSQAPAELLAVSTDLGGGFVSVVDHPVDTLDFYRLFVAASRPAIIRGTSSRMHSCARLVSHRLLQRRCNTGLAGSRALAWHRVLAGCPAAPAGDLSAWPQRRRPSKCAEQSLCCR